MENIQTKDIILPVELATGLLTLEEIGAIVVLMSLPSLEPESISYWNTNERLMDLLEEFIDEGIAQVETIDGVQNLTFDLTDNSK